MTEVKKDEQNSQEIVNTREVEPSKQERQVLTPEQEATKKTIADTRKELILFMEQELDCGEIGKSIFEEIRGEIEEGVVVGENSPNGWKETKAVLIALKQTLAEAFKSLDQLQNSAEGSRYQNITDKKRQIVESIVSITFNEHLSAKDVASLIVGIKIISAKSLEGLPEDQQQQIRLSQRTYGYEGVMFYDKFRKDIILFSEAMVDKHPKGKLDIRHMISHEIAHGAVDRAILKNQDLDNINKKEPLNNGVLETTRQILDNAQKFLPFQTKHVKAVLASHLKGVTYNPETLSQSQKVEIDNKFGSIENYNKRRVESAEEILTDYTAIYLQSDGNFRGFVLTALSKCNRIDLQGYLGTTEGEIKAAEIEIAKLAGQEENEEDLIGNLPENSKTRLLLESYWQFYKQIKSSLLENKDSLETTELEADDDQDSYLDESEGFEREDDKLNGNSPTSQAKDNAFKTIGNELLNLFGFK